MINKKPKKYARVGKSYRYKKGKFTVKVGNKKSRLTKKGISVVVPTSYVTKRKYANKVIKIMKSI